MPNRTDKGKNKNILILSSQEYYINSADFVFPNAKNMWYCKKIYYSACVIILQYISNLFLNESLIFYLKFSIGFKIIEQI